MGAPTRVLVWHPLNPPYQGDCLEPMGAPTRVLVWHPLNPPYQGDCLEHPSP